MHILTFIILNIYITICVCIHARIKTENFININKSEFGKQKNKLAIKKNFYTHKNFKKKGKKKKIFLVQATKEIIIGTRNSPLAIKQSEKVKKKLLTYFKKINENINVILKPIKTTGDKILDKTVGSFGGKGIFTKELDEELIKNNVDICVHSLKDIPTVLPDNIHLSCFLKRDTINDAFLSIKYKNLRDINLSSHVIDKEIDLPRTIATSSLRRTSQIRYKYKNLKLKFIRGNINTRIAKLFNNSFDSIIIAFCGLERLVSKKILRQIMKNNIKDKSYIINYKNISIDLRHLNIQKLNTNIMCPALCQGIIGVTSNKNNPEISQILKNINNEKSQIMANIERAFLQKIDGSCTMPIGGYTKFSKNKIFFNAIINDINGLENYKIKVVRHLNDLDGIADEAAEKIKEKIGIDQFNKIKADAALYYK
ncbi:porphobilinogen deaminase [Plasmodium yoelii 17X]|uniref:hydroxymethylbilane synthase n=3 Tax=Plasmodium yoelii TaxID=5861 RepID=A0AAE9WT34_PLAYO|nr:porphobilinogen deaminase, putative [Plasmodium yoelii]ETB58303.1 porphobilinogen deaminase [Plasmodium yoelii 17X]WBY55973.1 porphobilinogen deaminase [Plasmodium yoelii yoelii]CDU16959.1 porphobilinogen deaminase, putative [Plasmodium yoelii]VTZ75292.1 porphobilinogen deaminase, putative [Plasmodium yoelii]|eukprot:XP_022813154.1 porphobilinogen deaminase, putative [Plasmodium yoelii]